jgi:hypothetical protein
LPVSSAARDDKSDQSVVRQKAGGIARMYSGKHAGRRGNADDSEHAHRNHANMTGPDSAPIPEDRYRYRRWVDCHHRLEDDTSVSTAR